jgi:hypothetical protein
MWAGQPRTGNAAYADLVEHVIGRENIFRGEFPCSIWSNDWKLIYPYTYSGSYPGCLFRATFYASELLSNAGLTDGVPTMVLEKLGYHHQYVCFTYISHVKQRNLPRHLS